MRATDLHLKAVDGRDMLVYHWAPDNSSAPPRGSVQIAHGVAEHAARYVALAEALTGAGYLVWAADHRGHGRSALTPEDRGIFGDHEGWSLVLSDVGTLNRHVAETWPALPRCLLGHSMGSIISRDFVCREPRSVHALALSGSFTPNRPLVLAGRLVARAERLRQGKRGRSALLESMAFGAYNKAFAPARTAFDWLSRDTAIVDAYVADPLCGFRCTNQLWVDFLDALWALDKPAALARLKDLPVYVIGGSRDPVSRATKDLAPLVEALKRAGVTRLEHRFYDEARHEVFNETNRAEVIAHLITWLDANLATARAAA